MSSAVRCISGSSSAVLGAAASRERDWAAATAMWPVSTGIARGDKVGAMVRRCSFQAGPCASSRPSPSSGARIRMLSAGGR